MLILKHKNIHSTKSTGRDMGMDMVMVTDMEIQETKRNQKKTEVKI